MEAAAGSVAEQWSRFRKQAPVDAHAFSRENNPIPSHRNDGLQQRHGAVGARRAMSPISALAGFRGERLDGAKLDQPGIEIVGPNVDSQWKTVAGIDTDSADRGRGGQKPTLKKRMPSNGTTATLRWPNFNICLHLRRHSRLN